MDWIIKFEAVQGESPSKLAEWYAGKLGGQSKNDMAKLPPNADRKRLMDLLGKDARIQKYHIIQDPLKSPLPSPPNISISSSNEPVPLTPFSPPAPQSLHQNNISSIHNQTAKKKTLKELFSELPVVIQVVVFVVCMVLFLETWYYIRTIIIMENFKRELERNFFENLRR